MCASLIRVIDIDSVLILLCIDTSIAYIERVSTGFS